MFKRIALHLDDDQACAARTSAAAELASRLQAELIGIYVARPAPRYAYDETIVPEAVHDVMRQQYEQRRRQAEDSFHRLVAPHGISAQWRAPEGRADEVLALHARCADLLIVAQPQDTGPGAIVDPSLVEAVGMSAGRPLLVIPYAGTHAGTGRRILCCWDHGRESARALADAATFLAQADELVVLTVDPESSTLRSRQTVPGDLQAWFRARGFPAPRMVSGTAAGTGVGNVILNTAADFDCDMIVMGLYGHSRAREWVLGGASRDIIKAMTVPTLLSH